MDKEFVEWVMLRLRDYNIGRSTTRYAEYHLLQHANPTTNAYTRRVRQYLTEVQAGVRKIPYHPSVMNSTIIPEMPEAVCLKGFWEETLPLVLQRWPQYIDPDYLNDRFGSQVLRNRDAGCRKPLGDMPRIVYDTHDLSSETSYVRKRKKKVLRRRKA